MKKNKTTNGFGNGINLDLSPLLTPNTVMTNALNATLLTMNGNELTLQNDMGNGRVETAYLPEGFIPLGSAELGGIIYIVSYNPLIDRCQIGSFPSPERNITSDEMEGTINSFKESDFYSKDTDEKDTDEIESPYKKLILSNYDSKDFILNPGDKYIIVCPNLALAKKNGYSYISAFGENYDFDPRLLPRYLRLSVVAISDNGQIVDITDSCVWQPVGDGYYTISTTMDAGKIDLEEYRDLVTSQYNVFACKHSGKLGIIAELECIDSFEIAWDALRFYDLVLDEKGEPAYDDDGEPIMSDLWHFYFYTNWTYDNDREPDKINLYGIRCDAKIDNSTIVTSDIIINNYPVQYQESVQTHYSVADTDIMGDFEDGLNKLAYRESDYYNFRFLTPYYMDDLPIKCLELGVDPYEHIISDTSIKDVINNDIKDRRRNDGSDNQFLICNDPIKIELTKGTLSLDITPLMPYGALNWLTQSFSIDLEKLGSGEIDLVEYRYWFDNYNNVKLSWGLDAYPERHRKINGVTFNFYEIDKGIIDWIGKNEGFLDNCKVINRNWVNQETEEVEEENITEFPEEFKYSFNTSTKSSYSGHFEESLIIYDDQALIKNKTYLLEIVVDYDGTGGPVKFYRIFYTQPIFNNYYFNDDYLDYANIVLEDAWELSYGAKDTNIESTTYNVTLREAIEDNPDEEGEVVDSIPSYNLEGGEGYYHIDNDYSIEGLSFTPDCTSLYDLFKIDITNLDSMEVDEITVDVSDLDKTPFNNSNNSRSDWQIKDPYGELTLNELEYSNGIISGNYKITIHNPIKLLYNKTETPTALYKLSELSYTPLFICGNGTHYSAEIWISDIYKDTYSGAGAIFNTGDYKGGAKKADDLCINLTLTEMSEIYDTLNSYLNGGSDILILCCIMNYWKSSGSQGDNCGQLVEFGYGDTKRDAALGLSGDSWTYKNAAWGYPAMDLDDESVPTMGHALICYAVKSESSITLFTIGSHNREERKWYGYTMDYPVYGDWEKGIEVLYGVIPGYNLEKYTIVLPDKSLQIPTTFAPFVNLRKLASTSDITNPIQRFGTIYYYKTFTETENINITGNVTISVYINDQVEVDSDLKVKNLYYTTRDLLTITYSVTRRVDNSAWIDSVTSYSDYFVIDKYNNIVGNNMGANTLVKVTDDSEGKKEIIEGTYNSIPVPTGIDDELTDSALVITRDGLSDNLKVSGNPSLKVNILWAYEEQAVAIKNMYII